VVGVLEPKDIGTGVSWDLLLFIGTILGFSQIFGYTGFSKWLGGILGTMFCPFTSNITFLLIAIALFFFVFRFMDTAFGLAGLAIIGTVVPSLMEFGLNPAMIYWVATLLNIGLFTAPYIQPWLLMVDQLSKGECLATKDIIKAGIAYFAIGLVALVIASYYWQSTGIAFISH
jgi:di/tricarboxylate transporter